MASNAGQPGPGPSPAFTLPTQAPSLLPILFSYCYCDMERGTGNHCREKRGEDKRIREREDGSLDHTQEGDRQGAQRKATSISQGLLLHPLTKYCIEDDADEQLVGDTSHKIQSYHLPSSLPVLAVTHTQIF